MKCPRCNTELKENAKFCNKCGKQIVNYNTHLQQIDYSNKYSKTEKEKPNDHNTQNNYSENYSKIKNIQDNNHNKLYEYSKNYSEIETEFTMSDEDYIKEFIGTKYEEFIKGNFSLPGFILGPIYLFYRKMNKLAFLIITLLIIVSIININYLLSFIIIINTFLGTKINSIYVSYATNKVNKIKNQNQNKNSKEILKLCINQGRINITMIILIIIFIPFILPLIIGIISTFTN